MPTPTPPLYRQFTSQADIDAQYNPVTSPAQAAAALAHYESQALTARQRLPSRLDVPYGPTRAETLDIFPAERPGAPVFVFLHGGYWRARSSKDFSGIALGLRPLGITTVVVDYALCPTVTLDEIVRQARAALAWVWRHIADHGGDPSRIALGGHSAGAQLTAMCLHTRWAEDYGLPDDPCAAALMVSGVYDLRPLRWSYLQPALQLDEGMVQRCSPLGRVRRCATPALITWGGAESTEFARQSTTFHAAWRDAGNEGELMPQPGADHFTALHGLEDPASGMSRWLAGRLGVA
ncbi:alpha/beta hydrolase [Aquabacterium sp. J223]|uniref:alpha/beta hydrolase n=1 Tax=Aquabacterium sp. J223 TaxID=2898431 RepID=UPI0021AE1211|nr:alpha/beta hydrolase [Aquabacterium sp. J223]UUX96814.1 alpha/beta hydrolase [Aquabacterium sp. J223]